MRFLFLWAAFGLLSSSYAQTRISGQIMSATTQESVLLNVPFDCWKHQVNTSELPLDAEGRFQIDLPIHQSQIIFFTYAGQSLQLYVEPHQDLSLRADRRLQSLTFGGSLSQENTFRKRLGLTFNTLGKESYLDSSKTPGVLLEELHSAQQRALQVLKQKSFHLSPGFLRMTAADIHFFAASKLWEIFWHRGIGTTKPAAPDREEDWRRVLKEAYQTLNLSDERALRSYHYQTVIAYYPRLLQYQSTSPAEAKATLEAVLHQPFDQARQEIFQKGKCYWEYAAFQYGLKGRALERAVASFLINGMSQGDFAYKQQAYADFMKRYPRSEYRRRIQAVMRPYLARLQQTQEQAIHFIKNSQQIPTLDSLISLHRGKVLYIDLWGSWCVSCRQEMIHAQALKDRFEGQPIAFIYLAVEHGYQPEKRWRQLIQYYQLQGHHVLAGRELEKNLEKIYAAQGALHFPSYILVDQSGKIVTLDAKHPSEKQALYEQIESLL